MKKEGILLYSVLCIALLLLMFSHGSADTAPLWQTISGDFQRTGQRAIDVQVNGPVQAYWKFSIQQLAHPPSSPCPPPYDTPNYDKEIIYSSPAISGDGKVFFGSVMDCPVQSGFNAGDGWFYALDQYTGDLLWTQNMHGWVESSPALSHDNSVVYVGSKSGMLTAMDTENGDKIWEFPTGEGITSSPAIDSEGTIYIGSLDGSLYAVRPDGTLKWSYDDVPTGVSIHASPALSQDESTVYFGHAIVCGGPGQDPCPNPAPDFSLIAVDTATGTFVWEFPIEGHVWGSAMVSPYDGSILFPTFYLTGDNYLYSVSPAGVENWRYQMDSFSNGIPSIGPDGTVYIGEFAGGSLYAINSDGTLKWQFELAGNINYQSSAALINGGDTVVFGTYTNEIYALNADDMSIQWIYTAEGMVQASVAVSPDGRIFFGDWGGVQHSIGTSSGASIYIGDQWANCGDVGVKIPICLVNLEAEVGAVQVDLCEDINDCLICVGCEMTERTVIFDCMVNELENGCCAVVVFSKNPGGVINPGECDIVIIDYTLKDDPECCNSCINIVPENVEVVDQYGYLVDTGVGDSGMVCPFECGDVEPAASTATTWDCGDGDVDIFDILEEVDFIIHVKDPDACQAVRADVPTGTPPDCDPSDGTIDVGDLMVIIDMALNRQDCCSYYYGGVIY